VTTTLYTRAWRVRLNPDNAAHLPSDCWYLVGDPAADACWHLYDLTTYRPVGLVSGSDVGAACPPEHRRVRVG
jgi:hypothetical protein